MRAVFKRELMSYCYNPMAYILIGLFILLSSVFFVINLYGANGDFLWNLEMMRFILVFIIPILTMRILAEDRKTGTEVLLITSPVSLTGVVLGKFFAAFVVFLAMTVITFVYPIILVAFGASITPPLIGAYAGFILIGASLISVGVFASSLTENQVIAAVISFMSLLIIWVIEPIGYSLGGIFSTILNWLSVFSRYNDFAAGILNISSIVYLISFTAVFLFLTIRVIERRRWSQG